MQQTLVIIAILCIYYKWFFELWLYNSKFLSIIMKVVAFTLIIVANIPLFQTSTVEFVHLIYVYMY